MLNIVNYFGIELLKFYQTFFWILNEVKVSYDKNNQEQYIFRFVYKSASRSVGHLGSPATAASLMSPVVTSHPMSPTNMSMAHAQGLSRSQEASRFASDMVRHFLQV